MLLGHPGSSIGSSVDPSLHRFDMVWLLKGGPQWGNFVWGIQVKRWRNDLKRDHALNPFACGVLNVFMTGFFLNIFESFCISAGSPHAFGKASALSGVAPGQSPEADELAMFWRANHVGFRYCFRCGNLGVWQSRMDSNENNEHNEHNELILGIFWKCTIETETVVVMENSWWEVNPSAGILGSYHKGETVVSLSLSAKIKQELKTRPLAKSSAMLFLLWIGTRIFWIHSCLTATAQWTGVCL